ncbi:MAG: LysR family transcriptional regulator [Betaproteobacteria bacterium]|nr:LysR family transcriptional regulator [Betaproteobacteria bacterium]
MSGPRISLDQWKVLATVVEAGGYARAAERIHRSQSTLTYAVQKLERTLGVKVFELQGRRAVLTPTGQLLYRRGRELVDEAARLEDSASGLARGWEPEISLAVEVIFPTWLLLECLGAFAAQRPDTRIELIESVIGGTEEALNERRVQLAITPRVPAGFAGDALMQVRFVCMAAPAHPLHALGRPLTRADLRANRHLLVRDTGARRDAQGSDAAVPGSWLNVQRLTVSNKATSIRAAKMGLGYAWYPEDNVREELASGELKPLPLREGAERFAMLYLVLADPDAAGPGTRLLAGIIRDMVRRRCAEHAAKAGAAPGSPR